MDSVCLPKTASLGLFDLFAVTSHDVKSELGTSPRMLAHLRIFRFSDNFSYNFSCSFLTAIFSFCSPYIRYKRGIWTIIQTSVESPEVHLSALNAGRSFNWKPLPPWWGSKAFQAELVIPTSLHDHVWRIRTTIGRWRTWRQDKE